MTCPQDILAEGKLGSLSKLIQSGSYDSRNPDDRPDHTVVIKYVP